MGKSSRKQAKIVEVLTEMRVERNILENWKLQGQGEENQK